MTPLQFHEVCMLLFPRFGASETSGYRTDKRNQAVGGMPDSRHRLWLACDVVLDDPTDQAAFVKEAQRQGLVVVVEAHDIHLQAP